MNDLASRAKLTRYPCSLAMDRSGSYHPKAVTAPAHDFDGNLVNDGRWVYSWDAENRLIQMESTAQAVTAGAPYRKLVFRYDTGGRRLAKAVYHGTAAAPVFASSTRWLHDGWNPISEFSAPSETGGTLTRTKSYTWGLDLSGTLQGAGGVGGLLAVTVHNGFSNTSYAPSYDGNGNIVAWTSQGATAPVSRREYDAFGNTLVEQGVAPSSYGFSTKFQDMETGLYNYGCRNYLPTLGGWISRDPIEESGGANLYGFVGNNGVGEIDYLGMRLKESTAYDSLVSIVAAYSVFAFTGDPATGKVAVPAINGSVSFDRKKSGQKCCARIREASYLDVNVKTILPNDWGSPVWYGGAFYAFTKKGYKDTVKHEFRRRKVYRDADKSFLNPAEGKGGVVNKCGWVCRDKYTTAETELLLYVGGLQAEAISQHDVWVMDQQLKIDQEVVDWRLTATSFWFLGVFAQRNVMFNFGYTTIHSWSAPPAVWSTQCPQ